MKKRKCDIKVLNREEYLKKIVSLGRTAREEQIYSRCSWSELSEFARHVIASANWFLGRKQFRTFGLYLQLYAEVWQYAYAHLELRDYQYFCQCQYMPNCGNVM